MKTGAALSTGALAGLLSGSFSGLAVGIAIGTSHPLYFALFSGFVGLVVGLLVLAPYAFSVLYLGLPRWCDLLVLVLLSLGLAYIFDALVRDEAGFVYPFEIAQFAAKFLMIAVGSLPGLLAFQRLRGRRTPSLSAKV